VRRLLLADLIVTFLIGVVLLGSPSTFAHYRFGWLAHVLIAVPVFVLARRGAYWLLIRLSAVALPAALIALPSHFGALDLILILWTLGALPLIGAGIIGRQIPPPNILRRDLFVLLILAGCIVNLRSIRAFPNFSATDEAIIFNYVDTFKRTGQIEASLVPYDAPTATGNLYIYAAALWTDLFPNEPFALRYFSALGGFALLIVVFLTTRALQDSLTAWIAVALQATNLLWVAVAHVGRQEVWLAAFVWAAFWLSLSEHKYQSNLRAFLAGLLVALSADVHPLGAYACVALIVWWIAGLFFSPITKQTKSAAKPGNTPTPLPEFGEGKEVRSQFRAFLLGVLIATAYYITAHILPDPSRFFAALRDEAVSYGAEGWTPLAAWIARHANYAASNPLELGLLLIGVLAALRYQRGLGVFVGVLMLLYALTVADPNLYYSIVWITGIVILTAVMLRRIAWQWHAPLLVAFFAAFILNITLIERHIRADWNDRALDAIQQVAAQVPLDRRGMGESFIYLALRDSHFIGFTFVNFWADGASITEWSIVESLKPDWIVTMRDERAFTPEFEVLSVRMPHMQLEILRAELARGYHLTDSIATSVGVFEIWRREP
jgi:hypothetical protein